MTTWTGATGSTDWFAVRHTDPNDPNSPLISNWSNTPSTPQAGDDVIIGNGVTVTDAFATQSSADPVFGNLSIGVGSSITTETNQSLNLTGNIGNSGILNVGAIDVQSANVQWTGGGTVVFAGVTSTGQRSSINFNGFSGTTATITNSETLTGVFSVNFPSSTLTLVNTGVINSNFANGTISFPTSTTVHNNNLIEATASNSSVNFGAGLGSSTIDNTGGGTLAALGTNSAVVLVELKVLGGTLHTNQSSTIQVFRQNAPFATDTIFDGTTNAVNLDGNLSVTNNTFGSGGLAMRGTVNVSAISTITFEIGVTSAGLTIQGNGVTLAAGSQVFGLASAPFGGNPLPFIQGSASTDVLHSNGTIHGAMTIVGLTVENSSTGVIVADGLQKTTIGGGVGATRATTITNNGLIEDPTSAGLLISSNTTIDSTGGGTLLATGAGSHVDISSAVIKGGALSTTNGGVINIADANVVLDGSASVLTLTPGTFVDFNSGGSLHLLGTIANNGSFAPGAAAPNFVIDTGNSVTLTGAGSVILGISSLSAGGTIGGLGGGTLINASNTISGFGTIGPLTLINQGLIDADVAGHALTLNTGVTIANNGTLEANGGSLVISDAVTGSGTAIIAGGGAIQFGADFQENVTFQGGAGGGSLQVADAYHGTISGFAFQDSIDLSFLSWSGGDYVQWAENGGNTGGTLSVLNAGGGTLATLSLAGVYVSGSFLVANDGQGHVGIFGASTASEQPDFNSDGKADILFQNTDGTPAVWLLNGTSLAVAGAALANPGPSWHAIAGGDFDGDGKADILWQNADGTPAVWLMNGTAVKTFGGALPNPGPAWHAVAAGDFDGDGKADILWQNDNGAPAVWLMNGTGLAVAGPALPDPGSGWHVRAAADFNGDGHADILWQNDNGVAAVWLMNGTNVIAFGAPLPNPVPSWHVQDAGDFNGDGKADILWQNDNGAAAVWLMNGTALANAGAALSNPGPSWHALHAEDTNGDGLADILWQNDNGAPAVWLMNGTNLAAAGPALPNSDPAWHVVAHHDFVVM